MDKTIQGSSVITEYVVRGAIVTCTLGSFPDFINMPKSHGVFLNGKPQLNIADSKAIANIKCFGTCNKSSPPIPCIPIFTMDWKNPQDPKLLIENKPSLTKNGFLTCSQGGVVRIIDSGQQISYGGCDCCGQNDGGDSGNGGDGHGPTSPDGGQVVGPTSPNGGQVVGPTSPDEGQVVGPTNPGGQVTGPQPPSQPSVPTTPVTPGKGVQKYSAKENGEESLSKDFKVKEFRSNDGADEILIDPQLVDYLQKIRDHFGKPVTISSGYRTPARNEAVGGARNSYHVQGKAADISIAGVSVNDIYNYAIQIGAPGVIRYPRKGFVHVDTRPGSPYHATS
ncbi:MAG: DUF4280 domain-containing protein [Clostridiales bacterium]|nr:DUF4280 domain-containing protein [Clostridiales bacterium]